MLQVELSLARIMDPPGAPRAGSGLRPRFGWMERRRPHPPARFICALSGFGLGQKLRRHFNPPWWGSVRSVGHGTIYRRNGMSSSSGTTQSGRSPRQMRGTLSKALRVCCTRFSQLGMPRMWRQHDIVERRNRFLRRRSSPGSVVSGAPPGACRR